MFQFSSYARKVASVSDKGDDLVDLITSFANKEAYNSSSSRQLHEFAHWLAMLQDFRYASTTRISTIIIPSFQTLSTNVATLKSTGKKCTIAKDKTKKALDNSNNVKTKNGEHSAMFHHALDMYRASQRETSRQAEVLRVQTKEFEELKLKEIKKVLSDFAQSELMFHTRAIEMYTAAYRAAQAISVEDDLAQFINTYEAMDDTHSRNEYREVESVRRTVASLRASISQPALNSQLTNGHQDDERYDVVSQPLRIRRSTAQSTTALHSGQPTKDVVEQRSPPQPAAPIVTRGQRARQDSDESETDSD